MDNYLKPTTFLQRSVSKIEGRTMPIIERQLNLKPTTFPQCSIVPAHSDHMWPAWPSCCILGTGEFRWLLAIYSEKKHLFNFFFCFLIFYFLLIYSIPSKDFSSQLLVSFYRSRDDVSEYNNLSQKWFIYTKSRQHCYK